MAKQGIKTKLRRLIVPKRLTVLLLTVILLAVPIVLYFTAYISNRTSYLTNRDFRQLASISEQLEDRIDQLRHLFIRAIDQTAIDQALQNGWVSQTTVNASNGELQSKSLEDLFQQHLGRSLQVVDAHIDSELEILKEIDEKSGSELPVSMELITGGETSTLYFVWKNSSGSLKASTKLDDIISSFIGKPNVESRTGSEHREGFDAFLIASLENKNTNGQSQSAGTSRHSKVIFQQGSSDLDIDSLDNLARADVPDTTMNLGVLTENSTLADIQLAGTTYRIYSQPIEIPLRTTSSETATSSGDQSRASGPQETSWVVCGLVQASHFRREAWAFPYTWLIVFVFVIVVVALSWPFLKLHFIGPKDRLKLADLYWIGFSLLVGSAILTFFMLYGVSYVRSEHVLDGQLEQFSNHINERFHNEIQLILKELSDLKARGSEDLKQIEPNKFVLIKPDDKITTPNDLRQTGPDKYSDVTRTNILIKDVDSGSIYPYFQTAVWMDEKGERRLEWTIDSTPSQGGFADRDYFKRIREGSSRGNTSTNRYWLEPITSKLTYERW